MAKRLARLHDNVEALNGNVVAAAALHEVWMPTARDDELHLRMGRSYASQALHIIRFALRREMLLSLMRAWDETDRAQSLHPVIAALSKPDIWRALVEDRVATTGRAYLDEPISKQLQLDLALVMSIYSAYRPEGAKYLVYKRLLVLRNVSLAHTQRPASSELAREPEDSEVDAFYDDTLALVSKLMSIVSATAIDYVEVADVYRHYAKYFWINARGELTNGHPLFRSNADAA